LRSLDKLFTVAVLEQKHRILGSTFPEKLVFTDGACRSTSPKSAVSLLLKPGKGLNGNKKDTAKFFAVPSCELETTGRKSNQIVEDLLILSKLIDLELVDNDLFLIRLIGSTVVIVR
jgi:hypothetical protein